MRKGLLQSAEEAAPGGIRRIYWKMAFLLFESMVYYRKPGGFSKQKCCRWEAAPGAGAPTHFCSLCVSSWYNGHGPQREAAGFHWLCPRVCLLATRDVWYTKNPLCANMAAHKGAIETSSLSVCAHFYGGTDIAWDGIEWPCTRLRSRVWNPLGLYAGFLYLKG